MDTFYNERKVHIERGKKTNNFNIVENILEGEYTKYAEIL